MHTRRHFLQQLSAGMGFAALPFPEITSQAFPNLLPEKTLGVALVGLGSYATHQLAVGLEKTKFCKLVGIVTGTPSKAEAWKKKYNLLDKNIYNYQNFDQIANNPDIDVVYVVLPNSMHAEYTIRAAQAGKHVICEKPMSVSVKEAEAMIAACKKAGKQLAIGYRLHYEPFNLEVARLGREKDLGPVKFIEASFGWTNRDINAWRMQKRWSGGGAMMDVGIYAVNACRYATGEQPISITAQSIKTNPAIYRDIEETLMWQMKFKSGAISNSTSTYNSNIQRLYIGYENGNLELGPHAYDYGPITGKTSKGIIDLPHTHHQQLMLDGICEAIINNKPNIVPGEEGLKDMKIIEAVFKAAETGKEIFL